MMNTNDDTDYTNGDDDCLDDTNDDTDGKHGNPTCGLQYVCVRACVRACVCVCYARRVQTA